MSYFISSRTIIYSSPKREGEKQTISLGCRMVFGGGGDGGGETGGGTVVATRVWEESLKRNDGGRRVHKNVTKPLTGSDKFYNQTNKTLQPPYPPPPRHFSLWRNYHKLVFEYGYFNAGSISVSGQLPTYPSPNPTLTLTCHQLTVVGLGEG